VDTATRQAYDAGRDLSTKGFAAACYAPFTSLYLDPHGDVLACCQNTEHVLGNVADQPLSAIWRGPRTQELRRALADYDLGVGCRFCAWQVEDGNHRTVYARSFEDLPAEDPEPAWPRRLELALSNTCNLECVMCDGEWSSKIRSRREGRPPLPKAYDDAFFEDLAAFLPHLDEIRFLGGEPFLAAESLRVMEMLIDAGLSVRCNVTTNGTQWNPRIERILASLPVSVAVSLDGVTAGTVEAIRVGADHPTLVANLARYREATRARGTDLALTFCLMRENWHEFADYLRLGDDWDAVVHVNTVIDPAHSLFHLAPDELAAVLEGLSAAEAEVVPGLDRNRSVWDDEVGRLRSWHERTAGTPVAAPNRRVAARWFEDQEVAPLPRALRLATTAVPDEAVVWDHVVQGLDTPSRARLRCDADDVVRAVEGDGGFVGVDAERCVGLPFEDLARRLAEQNGDRVRTLRDEVIDGGARRQVVYRDRAGQATYVQVFAWPEADDGAYSGSTMVAAWSSRAPAWAPGPAA
jgi:radical SAM protein with 4Fe4S-binding SPASM domain